MMFEDCGMQWFRMYSEARNDAKLRSLPDDQFRVWFNLICLASEQPTRGTIAEYPDNLLALEVSRGDGNALETTCNALQALRVLQVTKCPVTGARTLVFLHFAERQFDKPSDAPERVRERVRKSRAKTRSVKPSAGRNGCNAGNAPVTPPVTPAEQSRAEQRIEFNAPLARRGGAATRDLSALHPPPAAAASENLNGPMESSIQETVALAGELFGDDAAATVVARVRDISHTLGGRWDCYSQALRKARFDLNQPGAKPIANLHALCLTIAKRFVRDGVSPAPVSCAGKPRESELQRKDRLWREQAAEAVARACDDLEREKS